ncbi:NAD(P)/FAD-dependent oxidoreductase [Stieleria marina]|uniref:NAD(P)/FAD-dependent oxidoreductase n=1 Tax=Stieleria marina TaxID=1930275 RepID=UPI003AF3315A
MTQVHDSKVLVIGAGVAGASCALMLARVGVAVDLVEQRQFPRAKVCGCCIGPAGLEMLDRLSLRQAAIAESQKTTRWLGSFNGRQVDMPIPDGIAISRKTLDPMIVSAAETAGANVTMQCTAELQFSKLQSDDLPSADDKLVDVTLKTNASNENRTYSAVVVAAGLSANRLDKWLPWQQVPHGPFGVSLTVANQPDTTVLPGVIYMACDDDGYVGLVRLNESELDVAAALCSGSAASKRGTPLQRIQRIVDRSCFEGIDLQTSSPMMTTPMLRRKRLAGKGRIIAIGDAAGYVEPFTGEGMTWAMQSGVDAAKLIAHVIDQRDEWCSLGAKWTVAIDQQLQHKKRLCRLVTNACRSHLMREAAGITLARFPSLATPLLSSINRI